MIPYSLDGRTVRLKPDKNKKPPRRETWEHGTYYGYTRKACRCVACTKANRDYCAAWRQRQRDEATT